MHSKNEYHGVRGKIDFLIDKFPATHSRFNVNIMLQYILKRHRAISLRFLFLILVLASSSHAHDSESQVEGTGNRIRVLIYSNTAYYRHPEIPAINRWLVIQGDRHGMDCDVTEHHLDLKRHVLEKYDVLVLNNANQLDQVIPEEQRKSVEEWFAEGKGIVGLHAALVMQHKWPWLVELGGCDFNSDSEFLRAKVVVDQENKSHPAVAGAPAEFWYSADWTNHTRSVTGLPGFKVLLRVDETTYEPVRDYFRSRGGKAMGKDHPIAWTNERGASRFFYTELGHDLRSLNTEFGSRHVMEGIRWAANSSSNPSDQDSVEEQR